MIEQRLIILEEDKDEIDADAIAAERKSAVQEARNVIKRYKDLIAALQRVAAVDAKQETDDR